MVSVLTAGRPDPKHRIYQDDWISPESEKNMVSEINAIPDRGEIDQAHACVYPKGTTR